LSRERSIDKHLRDLVVAHDLAVLLRTDRGAASRCGRRPSSIARAVFARSCAREDRWRRRRTPAAPRIRSRRSRDDGEESDGRATRQPLNAPRRRRFERYAGRARGHAWSSNGRCAHGYRRKRIRERAHVQKSELDEFLTPGSRCEVLGDLRSALASGERQLRIKQGFDPTPRKSSPRHGSTAEVKKAVAWGHEIVSSSATGRRRSETERSRSERPSSQ